MIKSSCYIFHTKRNVKRSLRAWEKQRALTNNKCPLLPQKVEMLTANTKPSTSFKHYRTNCDSFSNVQIYVTLKRCISNLLINFINIDHGIFLFFSNLLFDSSIDYSKKFVLTVHYFT